MELQYFVYNGWMGGTVMVLCKMDGRIIAAAMFLLLLLLCAMGRLMDGYTMSLCTME